MGPQRRAPVHRIRVLIDIDSCRQCDAQDSRHLSRRLFLAALPWQQMIVVFERAAGALPKGGVSAKEPGVSGIRESIAEG
jgi:hypothetical protein